MARTREVAGGGRAVEVEPERLRGWFARFADRHGGLAVVDEVAGRPADRLRFVAGDGVAAEVTVPFGGLPAPPPASRADPPPRAAAPTGPRDTGHSRRDVAGHHRDPACAVDALYTHLTVPRRVGIVLVRLGGYSVGVAVGDLVEASTTGARPVHGRTRKGGSSSGRFARRRDNQAKAAAGEAADECVRLLVPAAKRLTAVVTGGDRPFVDAVLADARLAPLRPLVAERFLNVPNPKRAVLEDAIRTARSVRIKLVERD